jgi:hypothetical protein
MKSITGLLAITAGIAAGIGAAVALFAFAQPKLVGAASNDRYQDFVMATGAVNINSRIQTDGVWLLDYKSGKLLGTVIDKSQGKIVGWAEVDLVDEYKVQPKQDVHFMMTTGYITQSQSALYVAETTTGQFGVYTMASGPGGQGIVIKRHDLASFRKPMDQQPIVQPVPQPLAVPGPGVPLSPTPTPTIPNIPK